MSERSERIEKLSAFAPHGGREHSERAGVSVWLTKRRAVDLCRVAACLCPRG